MRRVAGISSPASAAAVLLLAALALASCGGGEAPTPTRSVEARPPAPAAIPGPPCGSSLPGDLRVEGVGCVPAERVVRRFAAEARSPETVLTVNDFVCEGHGGTISCSRGTARIAYAPEP